MNRKRAFTLIEVLVVVSIIVLLVGILMPSLKEVRRLGRRTVCQKNLEQIGVGMHAYLTTNKDIFPTCARLPSYEKVKPIPEQRPPLPLGLKRELANPGEVFACPSDKNTLATAATISDPAEVIPTSRYYDHEGTSYEWEETLNGLNLGFRLIRIYAKPPGTWAGQRTQLIEIMKTEKKNMWMAYDFEAFHGGPGIVGSHNVLYTDLHVQADKWRSEKKVGKELDTTQSR